MISRLKWPSLILTAALLIGAILLVLERKNIQKSALPKEALSPEYFSNQFVEIKIPGHWTCKSHEGVYLTSICSAKDDPEGANLKITLSASLVDSNFSISDIQASEMAEGRSGKIITTKTRNMEWVDSGIMSSPKRVSRILKTETADLLVTVVFDAKLGAANEMEKIFDTAILDLAAFRRASH